ncbi:MSP domain protein [Necator americanus]|uniref:Major sperm protein n=1 Tax=Necator americanus TaxID=51031 RepID=W2TT90_NECAM|nr:MSP domain protein [Necator americanus]ETN84257.1 MSP domain protein [Necator americanus]
MKIIKTGVDPHLFIRRRPIRDVNGETWESALTLQNTCQCGVLFKVKCTSNARIEIDDCADILLPGNEVQVPFRKKSAANGQDQLMVLYCLVGKQWMSEGSSAFRCWERAKKQDVITRRKIINIIEK